jgi:hypothetical protein
VVGCCQCPVFASFTLAFALQLRKKQGQTSVRVRKTSVRLRKTSVTVQYIYYQKHPHSTKPSQTHTLQNPLIHTLRINLNCFLISMSVWTVFISKYQFGLSSQLHVWSSTIFIATYQVVLSSYLRIKLLVFPHTYQNKMSLYYIYYMYYIHLKLDRLLIFIRSWIFFMSAYQLYCLLIYLSNVNSLHICVPSRLSSYLRIRVDCLQI